MNAARWAVMVAAVSSGHAWCQEAVSILDKVEVVGSRISRPTAETALPVQIISRQEIERSGVQTTEELLAKVSANVNAYVDALTIGNDAKPGISSASLRGLSSTATLVLLNGRRLANYAFTEQETGVDLHSIPLAAIERVEILKDGASAIYGSDAIAGVINFVLRSDFRGVEATAYAGTSQAGGGSQGRATISAGVGSLDADGYNVFATVDHQKSNALAARDRSFSATSYRPDLGLDRTSTSTFPGNIALPSGRYTNPAAPGCTDHTVFKAGGCSYDYASQIDDLAPLEQTSVLARASVRVGADAEVFSEVLYEVHNERYRISATPISSLATNGVFEIDVPTTSPYYPRGLGLTGDIHDVRYRTVTLGPRTSDSRSDSQRLLLGMKGSVGGWDYDGALGYAASHAKYGLVSGYVGTTAIANAFGTGLVDPFGDSGPIGDALLAGTQVVGEIRHAVGVTRTIDAHASKEVAQLPAGPLAVAFGGEWRRETIEDIEAPISAAIVGGAYNPPKSGARDVQAAFLELDVPVLRDLETQLSARRDHYSDFGTSWNPKVALRWQPSKRLLARASAGRGFRAPTLPELYTARAKTLVQNNDFGDPLRCPTTQLDSDCEPTFLNGYGGNPQLKPVRSTQASVGIVVQPTAHWSGSIDYWTIELRDNIGVLDIDALFENAAVSEGKNVVRGPVDPAYPGLPGPITEIDTYNQNLGRTRTSGFDVTAAYRSDATAWGRFSARLDGTLVTAWTEQVDGVTYVSALGTSVNDFPVPRWKHQLSLDWEHGPFVTTLGQSFRSGYTELDPLDGSTRHVASYALWDVQLAYAATKDISVRLGVRNLFDRDPPFSDQDSAFQAGYDPSYADPRGRFFYVSATVKFH